MTADLAAVPRVTVVIPTHARPELLLRAIRSVQAQTLANFELLVIVDGTDAPTLSALAGVDDGRLRVLVNERNLGAGRSRDRGADEATADWIAFLDDDDEWLPEKLERQVALTATGPSIITAISKIVTPYAQFLLPAAPYDGSIPFDEWMFDRRSWLRRGEGFLQTSSLLVPRALFKQVRFGTTRHEEWELVLRATKQLGYPLLTVPQTLVMHYRDEPRPNLSNATSWRRSVEWADALGPLLTRRAYSGFLLTTVAKDAMGKKDPSAFQTLLRKAFASGKPTLKQMFSFALTWIVPRQLRRSIRVRLDAGEPSGNR